MEYASIRSFVIAASLALAGGLAATAPGAAQEVTLRLHQFLPAQANVPTHLLDPWADKIEAESGGRIKIERYAAMSLGGTPAQLIDQVQEGVADIVWTLPGYTPGRFPATEVIELPFIMTNAEATSRAYWDFYEKHLKDNEFADLHIIATWVHGPGLIHSRAPIENLESLRGMKLRTPTRAVTALLNELGATPVGMPITQAPEALSKGVIDGTVVPWEVVPSLRIHELVSNHTQFGDDAIYTSAFVLAMNKQRYDSLPEDLKRIIDDNSGREISAHFGKRTQDFDEPGRNLAVERSNNIVVLDAEEVEAWKAAAQPVFASWIADMDGRGLDGQGLLDEMRALIEQYTANP